MTTTSIRRPPIIWMTFLDGRDHAVRDAEVAGCQSGIYETVCGALLLPASSHAAPRPDCHLCGSFVRAWSRTQTAMQGVVRPNKRHKHSRPGWFARQVHGRRGQHR